MLGGDGNANPPVVSTNSLGTKAKLSDWAETDFTGAIFEYAHVLRTDLSAVKLEIAELGVAHIEGVTATPPHDHPRTRLLHGPRAAGCVLDSADVSGADLTFVNFEGSRARAASFFRSNLAQAMRYFRLILRRISAAHLSAGSLAAGSRPTIRINPERSRAGGGVRV